MNHFSWFGAGALSVERQRTGLKLGSGSEQALELLWWKMGMSGVASKYRESVSRAVGSLSQRSFSREATGALMTTQLFHDWPNSLHDNNDVCF